MKQVIQKKNTIFIFALLLVVTTVGCDDDSKETAATTDGVWRSYGYGMVAENRENQLTRYEITNVLCILSGTERLDDVGVVTLVNDDTAVVRLAGGVDRASGKKNGFFTFSATESVCWPRRGKT